MSAPLVIPSVFTAIDRFSAPMKRMTSNMEAFAARSQRALNWANQGFNKLIAPITSLNNMLMGLGFYVGLYGLVRVLRSAINTFAEFEQAQVDLSVVLQDNSIPLMAKLSTQARTLAVTYGELAPNILKVQTALAKMGFGGEQIFDMTPAIIAGARAFNASPERVSEVAAGILLSYEKDSSQTKDVINKLAYAANLTAADFESFATQLPIVNRVAKLSGQSYEQVLAYLGTLRNVQIHTATGATSLKNILIDAGRRGIDFDTAIRKVANSNNAVIYAYKKFGKRSVVSAVEFAHQLESIKILVDKIKNAPENYVEDLARKQLQTFNGSVKLMKSAWEEFILSIESGKGPIAGGLKNLVQIATAMLLISANTESSKKALESINGDIILQAERWLKWLNIIGYITGAILVMRVVLLIWKAALFATAIVQGLWSAALAISAAMGWTNVMALKGNASALAILRGITILTTASTWGLNAAMYASPLVILTVGILGIVGVMKLLDNWIMSNVNSFNLWSSSVDSASSKAQKFYMDVHDDPRFKATFGNQNASMIHDATLNPAMAGNLRGPMGQSLTTDLVSPRATELSSWRDIMRSRDVSTDSKLRIEVEDRTQKVNIMPKLDSTSNAAYMNNDN